MQVHSASQLRARHVHGCSKNSTDTPVPEAGFLLTKMKKTKGIALKYQKRINSEMLRVKNLARLNHNEY